MKLKNTAAARRPGVGGKKNGLWKNAWQKAHREAKADDRKRGATGGGKRKYKMTEAHKRNISKGVAASHKRRR